MSRLAAVLLILPLPIAAEPASSAAADDARPAEAAPARPAAESAPTLESLLERAFAHEDALARQDRGGTVVVTTRTENLDRHGRVTGWEERAKRYVNGGNAGDILAWAKDGREMTEKERREAEREFEDEDRFDLDSPFRPEVRAKYRFRLLSPTGRTARIAFEPVGRPHSRLNVGTAEIEPASGAPVRIALRPSELPFYVKKLDAVVEYGAATPAGAAPSRMVVDAVGGLLFYKRTVRSTTTWSDRRWPSAALPR